MTSSITAQSSDNPKRRNPVLRGLWELLLHAVLQDRVIQRIYPGVMHLLIFWGVSTQLLGTVINLMQTDLFLPFELPWPRGTSYLWFELIMDIAGGMILVGVLMALFRRAVLRPRYLETEWDDWYALGILLLLPLLGFTSEAFRLTSVSPEWNNWTPIGSLFASFYQALGLRSPIAIGWHQLFFWSHMSVGLIFVASIPFTKLRHLITGPLNILTRPERPANTLAVIEDIEEAEKLGAGRIDEFPSQSLLAFDACVQCGRCEDVCPANFSGIPLSPRTLIKDLQSSLHEELIQSPNGAIKPLLSDGALKESAWFCTTCGACLTVCPLFINHVDAVVEMRRYMTLTTGDVPGPVGEALMGMERRGNPWSMPKEQHAPWVKELGIRVLQPGDKTDVLLFIGCAYGYDSRSQAAGRAFGKLLQDAGVDFAVLGAAENCCGETARRLGHEYLFQVMAEENIATFDSVNFERIVTPCAHCFNTLKNEYPQFGGAYNVQHHTEFLSELITQNRLQLDKQANDATYTYHDSCYLGRYNSLYQQPRAALDSIPGLHRSEMPRRLADGFCCGGGGGQMWMETDPNTRINHRRLDEAMEQGNADIVVTACPYCLIMFDDAIRSKGVDEEVAVKDIAEVLSSHLSNRPPA